MPRSMPPENLWLCVVHKTVAFPGKFPNGFQVPPSGGILYVHKDILRVRLCHSLGKMS
jgi:hypothetical protein